MKENKFRHFLALALAASMILSDVSIPVYSAEEKDLPVYCMRKRS